MIVAGFHDGQIIKVTKVTIIQRHSLNMRINIIKNTLNNLFILLIWVSLILVVTLVAVDGNDIVTLLVTGGIK